MTQRGTGEEKFENGIKESQNIKKMKNSTVSKIEKQREGPPRKKRKQHRNGNAKLKQKQRKRKTREIGEKVSNMSEKMQN